MSHPHEQDDHEIVATLERAVTTATSMARDLIQALRRREQAAVQRHRATRSTARSATPAGDDLRARWAAAHAVAQARRAEAERARYEAQATNDQHGAAADTAQAAAAYAAADQATFEAEQAQEWAQAWDARMDEAGVDPTARGEAVDEVVHTDADGPRHDDVDTAYRPDIDPSVDAAAAQYAAAWTSGEGADPADYRPIGDLISEAHPPAGVGDAAETSPYLSAASPTPTLELPTTGSEVSV